MCQEQVTLKKQTVLFLEKNVLGEPLRPPVYGNYGTSGKFLITTS